MIKVEGQIITYFDLFSLLKGLEAERPGIKKRIWKFMCDEKDAAFQVYNGRISTLNLFYYGVGDEYPLKYLTDYPDELEHCKLIHPGAFQGDYFIQEEYDLRLDLNLIWYVYEDDITTGVSPIGDIESFPVRVSW